MRLLSLLLLISILLLSLGPVDCQEEVEVETIPDIPPPPPTAPSTDSKPTPQSKNKEPISLNRPDFCRACQSVVEEFHKFTVRNFNDPTARRNTTMTRGELVEWFCRSGLFAEWKEPLVWGCIKTVQDHHDTVLTPFLGTHTSQEFTTLGKVFQHRIKSCAAIDACDPWVPETRAKDDCEACSRVVKDIKWSLDRELKVNKTIVERTLRIICMEVGMRHDKPMEVEAFCHEHVDEHWAPVQKMLVKVYNDPSIMPFQREGEIKKRFCGGMTEVCDAERAQLAAETKKRKEEERAARAAKRESKKSNPAQKEEL